MRLQPARLIRRAATMLRKPRPPVVPAQPAGTGLTVDYRPQRDGQPDPGEVVWAWVPYEEDAGQGKDRPVLIVGRDRDELVALMLTSRDHDRRRASDDAHGQVWMDVGAGGWDRDQRPSEVRLDRVLRLEAAAVRREGAALDRARFEEVAAAARKLHGWR